MVLISQKTINKAMNYVIRNNKRWGKYPMNREKDINRITKLLVTNKMQGLLECTKDKLSKNIISGWSGQRKNDIIITYNSNFLEIVALINYWNLWEYYKVIFVLDNQE